MCQPLCPPLFLVFSILTANSILTLANLMGSGIGVGLGNSGQDHNTRSHLRNVLGRLGSGTLQRIQSGALMGNSLPLGYALIDGQVMDVTYKIIQRSVQGGTAYYSYYDKMQENPIYMRPGNEAGWHYVVFQDPYFWRGSGHIILLKKVLGVNVNRSPTDSQSLYEAYLLSLRMPIHASIDDMDAWTMNKLQKRKGKLDLIMSQRMMMHRGSSNRVPKLMGRNPMRNLERSKRFASTTRADDSRGEDCDMKRLNILVYLIIVLVAAIGVPYAEAGLKRKIHGKKRLFHGGGGGGHGGYRRGHGHHGGGRGHGHYG
ncbi:unnamed protein product [Orchesella dallaii]|uniref:Uncharacterized protein n=1 Tax=Orchesella dallaii TaxID=48710 RepID=A0ABP1Q860_9HEXA